MNGSHWLRELRTAFRPAIQRGRRNRPRRLSVHMRRARVERLEERTLLATLTVNSPLDNVTPGDGLVTLREAIIAANTNTTTDLGHKGSGADTIQFAPAAFATPQTTQLVFGEMLITESLTINGPGRDLLTIDAQQQSRIFNFNASGNFTVAGLTLTRGRTTANGAPAGAGGALKSSADAMTTISDCTFTDNSTTGKDAYGGAVWAERVVATNCEFLDNSTTGESAHGGAVYAQSIATFSDCTFDGNSVNGPDPFGGANGGGFRAGTVTVTDSVITENQTNGSGGGFFAIYSATLTNVVISENVVHGFGSGGGFRVTGNRDTDGDAILVKCTVTGNTADNSGGFSAGYAKLTDCMISGNTARGVGGGFTTSGQGLFKPPVAILNNSQVVDNSATRGGGILGASCTLRASHD